MKTPKSKHDSIYDEITKRVIVLLEKGTVPWRKPWKVKTGFPRNFVSKKPYRGINAFLLHAMFYESPYWLTFHQAAELGGHVRKGEKACPIVFWKQIEVKNPDSSEDEKIALARSYYVFNVAQCEGLDNVPALAGEVRTNEAQTTLPKAEKIIAEMPNKPQIKHRKSQAYYEPNADYIGMPDKIKFKHEAQYFGALFHELIHWTGHPSRLNRPTLNKSSGFGSDPYCKEELIAEMGAAFLCGHAGIEEKTLKNSAAYLKNWLKQLENDSKLIVQSAAQAQKATDFILRTKIGEAATVE